jgi:hypothetical protein
VCSANYGRSRERDGRVVARPRGVSRTLRGLATPDFSREFRGLRGCDDRFQLAPAGTGKKMQGVRVRACATLGNMSTLAGYLVQYGDVIGYAGIGVIAFMALGVIQLFRRRRDLKRARTAVRLVTYSICEPRNGPVAVSGTYHESLDQRWIACKAHRVVLEGEIAIERGTRARWQRGTRTYALREGDTVIAIGVMSSLGGATWRLVPSPEEPGVQLYAVTPAPAPAPLWPWRAPLILAMTAGIAFFSMYKVGEVLVDKQACADETRLQIGAAMPLVRDDALSALRQCTR